MYVPVEYFLYFFLGATLDCSSKALNLSLTPLVMMISWFKLKLKTEKIRPHLYPGSSFQLVYRCCIPLVSAVQKNEVLMSGWFLKLYCFKICIGRYLQQK